MAAATGRPLSDGPFDFQSVDAMEKEKELGIPSVVIDCDFVDERSYSEGQVRTRLDALAERILANKGIRV